MRLGLRSTKGAGWYVWQNPAPVTLEPQSLLTPRSTHTGFAVHRLSHCLLLLVSLAARDLEFDTLTERIIQLPHPLELFDSVRQSITLYILRPLVKRLGIPPAKFERFTERRSLPVQCSIL